VTEEEFLIEGTEADRTAKRMRRQRILLAG